MIIRQIDKIDLKTLTEFSKKTFSDAFAHLNNPDDFNAFLETAFNEETLNAQLDTEGVLFYFVEKAYVESVKRKNTNQQDNTMALLKLNLFKSPDATHAPKFYQPFDSSNNKMVEIERIYVDTLYHGKGVAQLLMQKTEAVARQNKCTHIWLGVWSENPKAIRFYEKCGYKTFGEHVFTVGTDDQIDYLMIKNL